MVSCRRTTKSNPVAFTRRPSAPARADLVRNRLGGVPGGGDLAEAPQHCRRVPDQVAALVSQDKKQQTVGHMLARVFSARQWVAALNPLLGVPSRLPELSL